MNFLSHYFFDHNKNDHHFNFGLILPDLARNFVPGTRIKPSLNDHEDHEVVSIDRGCEQHVLTDSKFHQWEEFDKLQNKLLNELRNSSDLKPERDWFVAHIFSELMIDHQLLKLYPNLATELYNSFENINGESLEKYLLEKGMDMNRLSRFNKGFDHFMDVRYLTYYIEPESVVYSLDRICTRMRIPPFNVRQKEHYTQLIWQFERIIVETITKLQTLLK